MKNIREYIVDNSAKYIFLNNEKICHSWKNKSKIWGDPLHRTCSYNAMFPIRLADFFIRNYSDKNDVVLDPFSGRGTTLLQARILNRRSYASDLNPLSFVLSKSKEKNIDLCKILERLKELEYEWNSEKEKENYLVKISDLETMKIYYSEHNLLQLSFLREKIGKNWLMNDDINNFILSIILGLMHGPSRKDKTSAYFSLSMSNNVSMSPNYVKQYAKKNLLERPVSNIFELIVDKILKIYKKRTKELIQSKLNAEFRFSNALYISNTWKDIKPKLIFTSPPYLNIINYTKQNWIKMWMLGYEKNEDIKKIGLDDFHNEYSYINNFLIKFMIECSLLMTDNSKLIMVIGDVIKGKKIFSIINHIDYIQQETKLSLVEIYTDNVTQSSKATNSHGVKAGKATQIERIYVFEKSK
ncbi:DNA methyltransferase [Mycoplasma mycoides]|uniref:DNA methyltransferase n=1 Tax=Mycoplasma mycoides TaxID=2102 RepID=UPI00223EA790|nr:DNA methyltransferase [Mycoplasma mycoides]QVK05297.1 DNA methylase [Mycoplasma mycoides subsp. capri]QVK08608.1 DNA methylase [Mycoplasma mycoides subsp. capri]